MIKIFAIALEKLAKICGTNIASIWIFYQPKVPKSLRNDKLTK